MAVDAIEITTDPAISMARQALYRFAALSLLDPKCGSWEKLDSLRNDAVLREAAAMLRDLPKAVSDELAPGDLPLSDLEPCVILAKLPHSRNELNEQFENTFGLLVSNACPPYETEYINGKFSFQRSNTLADVSGFYRAFGMMPSRQNPERPDHIVQELEFMAVLVGLTRQAAGTKSHLSEQWLSVCRSAQIRFFREHLAWWAPAFATLLRREAVGGYYEATAVLLAALLTAERALLGIPAIMQSPAPTDIERPDTCEGCLLSSL